jgi:1-acyl-sn-glycerol-3-phosphate acyltransferase
MYGLGKSLPRGETLLVPFVCEINVGEPIAWPGDRHALIDAIEGAFDSLSREMAVRPWR